MPYMRCKRCGLSCYSAAYRLSPDHCSGCGAELPRPDRHAAELRPVPALRTARVMAHEIGGRAEVRARAREMN
jgi:hypothetical protein